MRAMPIHAAVAALVSAISLGAPPSALSSPSGYAQVEQVTRGNGSFGPSIVYPFQSFQGTSGLVSDFGNVAVFEGEPDTPDNPAGSPETEGLLVRDVVLGTTRQIGSVTATGASIDRTGTLIAFLDDQRLDPADENDVLDLYLYNRLTGRTSLVSRTSGRFGAALGVGFGGGIASGGRYAVFSQGGKVYRRDLLTHTTKQIAVGELGARADGPTFRVSNSLFSDDGQVVVTTTGIATPSGILPAPAGEGPNLQALVSSSGDLVVHVFSPDYLSRDLRYVVTNTRTREQREVPYLPGVDGPEEGLVRILPDDRHALLQRAIRDETGASADLVTLDLETGETALYLKDAPPGSYSRNLRYALASPGIRFDVALPAVLSIYGLKGAKIPGRLEVPSPFAWVSFDVDCSSLPDDPSDGARPRLFVLPAYGPVPARSIRLRAWKSPDALVLDTVVSADTSPKSGVSVDVPVGRSDYRLEVTARLVDGRVTRELRTFRGPIDRCP